MFWSGTGTEGILSLRCLVLGPHFEGQPRHVFQARLGRRLRQLPHFPESEAAQRIVEVVETTLVFVGVIVPLFTKSWKVLVGRGFSK